MTLIFGAWYTSLSVSMAFAYSNRYQIVKTKFGLFITLKRSHACLKYTLLCPLLYHVIITYAGIYHTPAWRVQVQPEVMPIFHGFFALLAMFLLIQN